MSREIGTKEQIALDTKPFSGFAQHYYVLWLRACDDLDNMEAKISSMSNAMDQAPHAFECAGDRFSDRECDCWKAEF